MGDSLVSDGVDAGDTKYFLSRFTEGELVWVKGTKDSVWDLGKVIAAFQGENETVAVKTKKGRNVVTKRVFGGEEIPVVKNKAGYSDMTAMRFVNEPQILQNLETRSYHDHPYTFMGPVLVAVNPLKPVLIMDKLKPGDPKILARAHPFAIAELSYQQLIFAVRRPQEYVETPQNQTVIVSGESGAGKTVSSKLVLQHLVARSGGGDLADAIIGSNPVTESFGNSMTLRNPNSSRFGKMLTVVYDDEARNIVGATVGTYLLERSRITVHETGERNFHIFYELLQGGDDKLLEALYLEREGNYKALIPHSEDEKERVVNFLDHDKANFEATTTSLKLLGFEGDDLTDLFGATAAVLHLSNVAFDDVEIENSAGSKVNEDSRKSFDYAAELLGISSAEFETIFTSLQRKVGKQVIISPVSAAQAAQLLEGVCRALYTRIFEFMIISINKFVNKVTDEALPRIGVLDIFGFETFARNDLEQLLINYTNEALQLTFNKQVLEAEAALYEREKLAISEQDRSALDPSQVIDHSNKMCIDLLQGLLIDAPVTKKKKKKKKRVQGILDIIHDQGRVPGPTEQKMLQKLHKTFAKDVYPNYLVVKKRARTEFIVKHYAGEVTYTTGNFLLKNADILPKSTGELFMSSAKEITKNVWEAGKKLIVSKKASIVSTFRQQIEQLNNDLNSTQCSFIRCIKPNAKMHRDKGWFDRRYITVQLRNLSIPKTADVLKAGLPTRIPYDQLVMRYKAIFGGKVQIPDVNDERGLKSFIAALFHAFEIPRNCYKLGLTKVFFKSGDLDKLEEVLSAGDAWVKDDLDATSEAERTRVINRYRSYLVRRRWLVIFAAFYAGTVFTRILEAQRRQKQLELESAILIQKCFRGMVARKKYAAILYAKKLEEERIAREKAEAERKERERLAEIARLKELEQEKKLRKFMENRKRQKRREQERFAKMMGDFKKANKAGADFQEEKLEMKRKERARRQEEEKRRREEAERQRQELERLQKEREEQERQAAIAAEEERKARLDYEEKLRKEREEAERKRNREEAAAAAIALQLKRNEEKLREKQELEKVVEEIMIKEEEEKKERRQILLEDEEDESDIDIANPWYLDDDVESEEEVVDKHEQVQTEKVNNALQFLQVLALDDSDSDSSDSDSSDTEEEAEEHGAESTTVGNSREYYGPYIVQVHFPKLNEKNMVKQKRRFRTNFNHWKQCFAFVFPTHKRILLHHGSDTKIKVQFNQKSDGPQAYIVETDSFGKKKNVLHVSGARFEGQDSPTEPVNRQLIISFQRAFMRSEVYEFVHRFLKSEETIREEEEAKNKALSARNEAIPMVSAEVVSPQRRRESIRKKIYTQYALLKKAAARGEIEEENVMNILREQENDDEEN